VKPILHYRALPTRRFSRRKTILMGAGAMLTAYFAGYFALLLSGYFSLLKIPFGTHYAFDEWINRLYRPLEALREFL
jgi:hypothetical protein